MRNNVRAMMAEAHVTSKRLAKEIGVNDVAMSFILNGYVLPTPESLHLMCKVLSCKPSDLYEASDVRLISGSDPVSEASRGAKSVGATGDGLDHEHAEGFGQVVLLDRRGGERAVALRMQGARIPQHDRMASGDDAQYDFQDPVQLHLKHRLIAL